MMAVDQARLRPVTSRQNALVKDLRRAFSRSEPTAEGAIAIEGLRILEEAIRSGLRFQAVFFSETGRNHADRLLPQLASHVETVLLPDDVFQSAVATETPQGVAALVKPRSWQLADLLREPKSNLLLIALAGVQDPGNLGTVIRSAEAFSARGVLLGEKTAGQFNAKAVRASAGSVFRQPVLRVRLLEAIPELKQANVRIVATSSHKGRPLDEVDLTGPLALIVGSEGAGVPADIFSRADELVTILHSPRVESLNAGIASAVLLYEANRQRKSPDLPISRSRP